MSHYLKKDVDNGNKKCYNKDKLTEQKKKRGNKMTNKEIITMYRMEKGIPMDKELYTYGVWKKLGYQVRKGEKCEHKVVMWKYAEKTTENEEGEVTKSGRCFHRTMNLFTREQVEPIK